MGHGFACAGGQLGLVQSKHLPLGESELAHRRRRNRPGNAQAKGPEGQANTLESGC